MRRTYESGANNLVRDPLNCQEVLSPKTGKDCCQSVTRIHLFLLSGSIRRFGDLKSVELWFQPNVIPSKQDSI